jgi:hypothetical protein
MLRIACAKNATAVTVQHVYSYSPLCHSAMTSAHCHCSHSVACSGRSYYVIVEGHDAVRAVIGFHSHCIASMRTQCMLVPSDIHAANRTVTARHTMCIRNTLQAAVAYVKEALKKAAMLTLCTHMLSAALLQHASF